MSVFKSDLIKIEMLIYIYDDVIKVYNTTKSKDKMSEIKKTSLFESIVSAIRITTAIFIIVVFEIIRYSWALLPIVLYTLSTIINIPIFIIVTIEDINKRTQEDRVKRTHEDCVKRMQEKKMQEIVENYKRHYKRTQEVKIHNRIHKQMQEINENYKRKQELENCKQMQEEDLYTKRIQETERHCKQIQYLNAVRSKRLRDLDKKHNPDLDKCVKKIHGRGDFNIIKTVKRNTDYIIHLEEFPKVEQENERHSKRMRDLETPEKRDIRDNEIADYRNKVSTYNNNKQFR